MDCIMDLLILILFLLYFYALIHLLLKNDLLQTLYLHHIIFVNLPDDMCFGSVNGELTPYALTVLIMRLGSAITISATTARLAIEHFARAGILARRTSGRLIIGCRYD